MDNWTTLNYEKLSGTKIIETYFELLGTNLVRFDPIDNNGRNARQPSHSFILSKANKKS